MSEKKNSDRFNMILKKENETTKRTLSQLKRENEFYERSFSLLYNLTIYLCDLTKSKMPSRSKFAILTMLPRLLGTMQSIRILGLKGYYYDMAILERSILENIGLCAYLATNEEEARNWLRGKDISIPKIKLLDELYSFLSSEKVREFKEGKAIYGKLSNYVHASLRAIGPSFLTPSPTSEELKVDVDFPPFFRKEKVPYVSAYAILLLFVLIIAFKNDIEEKWTEKVWNFIGEYVAEIESSLK